MTGSALFSDDGRYRYWLGRQWGPPHPTLLVVLLNGSKADATRSDNTVTRCVHMAQGHGYGRLLVGNAFGLMSTQPSALYSATDPVGPDCDGHLARMIGQADDVLVGWGDFPRLQWRFREVLVLLGDRPLWCLGRTASGAPRHPSRLAASTPWELFREGKVAA